MVSTLVGDFLYLFKQKFSNKDLYLASVVIMILRVLFPVLIAIKNICQKVCTKDNNQQNDVEFYAEPQDAEDLHQEDNR